MVHWTGEFVLALVWLAVVLSIGSIGLLYWLIRRSAATSVASLFYLVPAVTALMAYVLFGERLDSGRDRRHGGLRRGGVSGQPARSAPIDDGNSCSVERWNSGGADLRIGGERAFAALW